jgi:hypothetical protein
MLEYIQGQVISRNPALIILDCIGLWTLLRFSQILKTLNIQLFRRKAAGGRPKSTIFWTFEKTRAFYGKYKKWF